MWVYVAIALALAGSSFVGGWQVRAWKAGHDELAQVEQTNRDATRRVERASDAAVAFEGKRAAETVRRRAADQEIRNVTKEPVYAGACFDDRGMQQLAAEIARNPHTGELAAALPATQPASGNKRGFRVRLGNPDGS